MLGKHPLFCRSSYLLAGKCTNHLCSAPRPPEPAPVVFTTARHGETVNAEASISGSNQQSRCQDTGIQLAAATDTGDTQVLSDLAHTCTVI